MADKPFLAAFLAAAHGVHISGAGTKETSYYTALDNLLDGIGETLKPKVRCVMQLKSLGAGNPDGTLATTLSFIPTTAPMIMPIRSAAGAAPLWQVGGSVSIVVVSGLAALWLRAFVYRRAALRTVSRSKVVHVLRAH